MEKFNEKNVAWALIRQHTIGDVRDDGDLINAQYHSLSTISFIEELLVDTEGTIEEKISFIKKVKEEIPKFNVKQ